MNNHIHRLAALLSEDPSEYDDLEDADAFQAGNREGYGCGSGCWQYESIPITINGNQYLGGATIHYQAQISGRYIRATRYSPEEYPDLEIWDPEVSEFSLYTPAGDEVCDWKAKGGKRFSRTANDYEEWQAGFQSDGPTNTLDDETLKDVLKQIISQFDEDQEEVMEYEWEQSGDYY